MALYNTTAAGLLYCCPMDVAWFTEVIAAKHGFAPERLWVYEEMVARTTRGAAGAGQEPMSSRARAHRKASRLDRTASASRCDQS